MTVTFREQRYLGMGPVFQSKPELILVFAPYRAFADTVESLFAEFKRLAEAEVGV